MGQEGRTPQRMALGELLLRRRGAAFRVETVADPRLGLDVLFTRFALKFFAQLPDKDAQILRLVGRLRTPHRGQQRTVRHHPACVAREVQQQVEFLGRKVDGLALHSDAMGVCVNDKVTRFNGGGGALGSAAQMGTHAGEQFLNSERLGHVVVSAGIESFNFGPLMFTHGENQYRG